MNCLYLEKINKKEFDELYDMLNNIKLPIVKGSRSRRGFPPHRKMNFGMTRERYSGVIGLSTQSIKHPEIFNELLRIGDLICDFPYTSIHVNHNVICPKHKDEKNNGDSVIVSFGEYTGCKLIVEGVTYNTNCHPIQFNGSIMEHYNTNDLVGNKYSLVFYKHSFK
jgi:hypothetical protein